MNPLNLLKGKRLKWEGDPEEDVAAIKDGCNEFIES